MALMIYGTTEQAMQEATWFQEGGPNQPERRFYGITDEVLPRIDDLLEKHLDRIL
jgi:hypothetical protein